MKPGVASCYNELRYLSIGWFSRNKSVFFIFFYFLQGRGGGGGGQLSDVDYNQHASDMDHRRCRKSSNISACRRCSNYIFILDLTSGFKGFGKDSHKTVRGYFKCWDLVRLILETSRYFYIREQVWGLPWYHYITVDNHIMLNIKMRKVDQSCYVAHHGKCIFIAKRLDIFFH